MFNKTGSDLGSPFKQLNKLKKKSKSVNTENEIFKNASQYSLNVRFPERDDYFKGIMNLKVQTTQTNFKE